MARPAPSRSLGAGRRLPSTPLLALILCLILGCGQPRGSESPASGGSGVTGNTPMSMEGTYEDTGLPKRFEFDGKTWEIMQDIDAPEGSYEKGAEKFDGKPVYHDLGATPPYTTIYLKVEGKDRFLQYAPARGR